MMHQSTKRELIVVIRASLLTFMLGLGIGIVAGILIAIEVGG